MGLLKTLTLLSEGPHVFMIRLERTLISGSTVQPATSMPAFVCRPHTLIFIRLIVVSTSFKIPIEMTKVTSLRPFSVSIEISQLVCLRDSDPC